MTTQGGLPGQTRREARGGRAGIFGWMMFDFAGQPFFTVMTTFVFGPYVVSRLASDPASGQAAWSYGIAAAGITIAILSPILGSIADQRGPKKPWIAAFAAIQIVAMALLWFAAPGSSLLAVMAVFAAATICAEFAAVFNDSMLPRLAGTDRIGAISNTAWGIGYGGGMIALAVTIGLLAAAPGSEITLAGLSPAFGLDAAAGEDARITGPFSALWYALFLLPLMLLTPDLAARPVESLRAAIAGGLSELRSTLADVKRQPGLASFLVARMIYQDGVNALLAIGGGFAAAMFAWSTVEIGLFGIILNCAAIPACLIAGRLDRRFGSKALVIVSIVLLAIATLGLVSTRPESTLFGLIVFAADGNGNGALFGTGGEMACILFGLFIGAAFGPVQASSRAWMARSVPESDAGRYFGLYALSGRATSFLAPLAIALITQATGSARLGLSVLLLFFTAGLILALRTPYPAGDRRLIAQTGAAAG